MSKRSPIQECILNIYKKFYAFCQENNLRFCGVAGTAIGAVRHKGFIPGDDDLDVGMPIEDFVRFRKLCQKGSLPEGLEFIDSLWMGGKVYDKNTTIFDIRDMTNFDRYHGVYIDVFPMIGLPDNEDERERFVADLHVFTISAELYEHYPYLSSLSGKQLKDWKNHMLTAYSFEKADKVAGFTYFICQGDGFRNPKIMDFEDAKMPISSSYDWDLTQQFGDYMTPPPKADQRTHDKYHYADLNKPFTDYIKEVQSLPKWFLETLAKKQRVEGELTQYSNSLKYMLDEANRQNEAKINEILNSRSYKISRAITKPYRLLKRKK